MRHLLSTFAVLVLLSSPGTLDAQDADARERVATDAAESWLALLDGGEYTETWAQAAPIFRDAVSAEQWEAAARQVVNQTGPVGTRTMQSATYESSLPNTPPGDYMVLIYRTRFERLSEGIETLILRREAEDQWKVVGYFVRPAG